jgi:non-specific protein-tyrosine kinase
MTLQQYLRVIGEQWLFMLAAVVLGLLGALAIVLLRPPEYTASLTMYVSAQAGDSTTAAYQGGLLSEQRVKSYVKLVKSTRIIGEVVARLRLDETPEGLAKRITVTSPLDSTLLDVTATDRSPARATEIVNTIGEVFPQFVSQLEPASTPVVRVAEPAIPPAQPSSAGWSAMLGLGLLGGLAVGIGGALARNQLPVTVRSPAELPVASNASNGITALSPEVPKQPLTVHEDPQ